MPELPDVEGFRRVLAEHATRRRIKRVDVADAGVLHNATVDDVVSSLEGRALKAPSRHGKWLLAHTDGPTVLLHFGMTGRLLWCERDSPRHDHDRVVLVLRAGELRYRDSRKLRGIWLAKKAEVVERLLGDLGPDALDVSRAQLDTGLFAARRKIKPAMVDQTVLAGIGNLLADEILWRARIHPDEHAADLTTRQRRGLHDQMRRVLRESVRAGRVVSQPSWLTGVRNDPDACCPRCSTRLCRRRTGRTTVWCPQCQPCG